MPKAEITIKVTAREDYVPVNSFLTVIGNTLSILRDLGHVPGVEEPINWKVSAASLKSPLSLTIFSEAPHSDEIVREYLDVFQQAEKSEALPFNRWNPRTLEKAKQLVSVLNDGVAQVTFSAIGASPVTPTQRVAASVDYLLAPAYEDYGSFEGKLETLSVHGKTRFNIYDPITGRSIQCFFALEKLQDAHSAFNHRVVVSGKAKYSRVGDPVSVLVEDIRVLVGGIKLADLDGIDITGGIESAMYIRGIRDA